MNKQYVPIIPFTAIIQVRLDSTRLPKKALLKIGNFTIIEHIYNQIHLLEPEKIIIAIPDIEQDIQTFTELMKPYNCEIYAGAIENVLMRFERIISLVVRTEAILRVCGDSPFLLPEYNCAVINNLFKYHYNIDYSRYVGIPDGLCGEAFTKAAFLKLSSLEDLTDEEREHVTIGFVNRPDKFLIINEGAKSYRFRHDKYSIDTIEDYERLKNS